MFNFKKPRNELELYGRQKTNKVPTVPDEMYVSCPVCKNALLFSDMAENANVCFKCTHHFKMNVRQRLNLICDGDSFEEMDKELVSENILDFPEYDKKLNFAKLESSENEAVVTGVCTINKHKCAIFVMDASFMMGSMGCVVGEKITRIFEYAIENKLPVVGFTVSGGARMQEGILSLMQMAKTSGVIKLHSEVGLLYITVLTNPTTGGVTASFAMEGDIIISEPNALICFAGPRVIEQTTKQKLPPGFQKAEFLLDKGFVDAIVSRAEQKEFITKMLKFHRRESV